jgi:hypothetical protein
MWEQPHVRIPVPQNPSGSLSCRMRPAPSPKTPRSPDPGDGCERDVEAEFLLVQDGALYRAVCIAKEELKFFSRLSLKPAV